MEATLLNFTQSLRSGNFHKYIDSMQQILPWMFALDHTNYARWLPVHLHDMKTLDIKNPQVYKSFVEGRFVIAKSARRFSALPIDHAHEQNNKIVKSQIVYLNCG